MARCQRCGVDSCSLIGTSQLLLCRRCDAERWAGQVLGCEDRVKQLEHALRLCHTAAAARLLSDPDDALAAVVSCAASGVLSDLEG